jgi:hypothetical protein
MVAAMPVFVLCGVLPGLNGQPEAGCVWSGLVWRGVFAGLVALKIVVTL